MITIVRDRPDHLAGMRRGLARQHPAQPTGDIEHLEHVVVRMGGADPYVGMPDGPPVVKVEMIMPSGADRGRLPLAAARNAGAAATSADLLVFLDVDCIPCPTLLARYQWAAGRTSGLLAGPVGYLPAAVCGRTADVEELRRQAQPHPARPVPADGDLLSEDRYELFWSLSFAIRRADFDALGGFCEDYVGYGGEDTDLAFTARRLGMPLSWVGGAWAWHQYHPVQDPPRAHLADIVRNAHVFHQMWGRWPMEGWLQDFADEGLVEWDRSGDTLLMINSMVGLSNTSGTG